MGVSSVSGGGLDPVLASAMQAASASTEASMNLLDMALEMVSAQQSQLLEALQAGGPQGVGGSFDSYA